MPPTPMPGDPTYESWLQMANSYGMTIDELYQAMVSYPAEQGAGYNYPRLAGTLIDPLNTQGAVPQAPAQPTAPAVGMYEGERYDPGGGQWNVPSALAWGAEVFAGAEIERIHNKLQFEMDNAQKGLANAIAANSPIEIEYFKSQVLQLRQSYQQEVVQRAQTGAVGYHAAQRAATTGMYLSGYEGLKGEVEQGFNIDVPLALTETEGLVPGYGEGGGTITPDKTTTTTGPTSGMTAKPSGERETAYPATPPSPFGIVPQNVGAGPGAVPSKAYAPPAGGGGGGQYPTENFRGFRNWNEMQATMGDDYGLMGGTANQLRQYLGNQDTVVGGFGSSSGMRQIQRVDLGQGTQDYYVRRDGMGNIRSFSPVGSHVVGRSPESQWRGNPYYFNE